MLGGITDPNTAYLLLRGLKTFALRMQQHNANGCALAAFLVGSFAIGLLCGMTIRRGITAGMVAGRAGWVCPVMSGSAATAAPAAASLVWV